MWEAFEAWLEAQDYAPLTIRQTLNESKRLVAIVDSNEELGNIRLGSQHALRRLLAFDEQEQFLDVEHQRMLRNRAYPLSSRRFGGRKAEQKKQRKRRAVSFSDADWRALSDVLLNDPDDAARVLEVLIATGLRIGDVLGIESKSLEEAMHSGVLRVNTKGDDTRFISVADVEEWRQLWAAWADSPDWREPTIARWLCPSGDGGTAPGYGAYQRINRKLKHTAKELKLSGRANLHRLRRTVGVQALRVTDNLVAVQQLLGHRSMQSTMHYLDEAQPDRVAKLQEQLKQRFREEEEED